MIAHALTIVANELNLHLNTYGDSTGPFAELGNLSEGVGANGVPRERVILSVVNIREEKALKNVPAYVRNDTTLRVTYENPPVFLNCTILIVATHVSYVNALVMLSRTIAFFQHRHVFTPDLVDPTSLVTGEPANVLDRLDSFKLIFDLQSPTLEEVNHLWGTLGGKQYPFALYGLRMLDLKFQAVDAEASLITEVVRSLVRKEAS